MASDDRPTVWIEVGTQLERLTSGQESFAPPFVSALLENPFTSPRKVQQPPLYSFGQEGRISFAPGTSDWIFSAAIRYGRANSSGNVHEQTVHPPAEAIISIPVLNYYASSLIPVDVHRSAATASQTHNSFLVLDFAAGRDVGLGVFGKHGSSTLNAGVRFAQFTSQTKSRIDSDPDFRVEYKYVTSFYGNPVFIKAPSQIWDIYSAKLNVSRSFSGLGPSLAWDASATILGNPDSSTVTFDWGLNGALLFGRQKMSAHHTTMARHGTDGHISGPLPTLYPTKSHNTARSRSVVVPNVGGFAGLSLRFPDAKVSVGYRIDAFFGAMDGGIDARKSYDRDFYGPFATISIGLGG
jgi:hypothetical protein